MSEKEQIGKLMMLCGLMFEAHKGERVTLTPGQARVLLMLMKMFQDLARRLSGEWKRG